MARICIFGAGAVGGHIAVRLANSGNEVSVIARGEHAAAISQHGLTVRSPAGELHARPQVYTEAAQAGRYELVFVAVKAHGLPAIAESIGALCAADTPVVFVMNGIPWWYAHGLPAGHRPLPDLEFLDPGGALARCVGLRRVVGSIVNSGNSLAAPGVIQNHSPGSNTVAVGEPDGSRSGRASWISGMLEAAGMKSPLLPEVHKAVWNKLVGANLAPFPVCSLLNQPLAVFSRNPELAALNRAILREGIAVAAAWGIALDIDPDGAQDPAKLTSQHKPSMAQDFERGKPLEIDPVLLAAQRFARAAGVPTPHFDAVLAMLVQAAIDRGLYSPLFAIPGA